MYHVNNNGEVGKCKAKSTESCPFGADRHFVTQELGIKFAEEENIEKYGALPNNHINEETLKQLDSKGFQKYIMTLSIDELNELDNVNNLMIEDAKLGDKSISMLSLRSRTRMIKGAKVGDNVSLIAEKQEARRLANVQKEKELLEKASKEFLSKNNIEFPESANYLIDDYNYNRVNISAYRGVSNQGNNVNKENGNMALYGQGLYTSSSRSEARKYGEVHNVNYQDLPSNPLKFKTELDFNQFEYELAKDNGFNDKREMSRIMEIDEAIWRMGYDGVVINRGDIIVNFDTERNKEEYNENNEKYNKK